MTTLVQLNLGPARPRSTLTNLTRVHYFGTYDASKEILPQFYCYTTLLAEYEAQKKKIAPGVPVADPHRALLSLDP